MKYVFWYLVFSVVNILTSLGIYMWIPEFRQFLLKEDGLIENLSVFFCIFAIVLSINFLLKIKKTDKTLKKSLIIISAIALFGFLDEISFGERIFGFTMPRIYGTKIDAIHDFFLLGYILLKSFVSSHTALAYFLIQASIIILIILAKKYLGKLLTKVNAMYSRQTCILMLLFLVTLFSATVIDLDLVHNNGLFLLEEIFEMNAVIALIFCCLSLFDSYKKSQARQF